MEYLSNICDKLDNICEDNIRYFNIADYPEYVYGNVNYNDKLDFCKFPKILQDECYEFGADVVEIMKKFVYSASGTRLRFCTDSDRFILKIKYRLTNYSDNTSFEVYSVSNREYNMLDKTFIDGNKCIFAKEYDNDGENSFCIFLANNVIIEELILGVSDNCVLKPFMYDNPLPIIFYGNSNLKDYSLSSTGNSIVNIVSRRVDCDIIQLSSSCCKSTIKTAEFLGKINCRSIVIDCTKSAERWRDFKRIYERFVRKIREFHPCIKIVFLTSCVFDYSKGFDEIVKGTYSNSLLKDENVALLDLFELFRDDNNINVNDNFYNDYAIELIADRLSVILDNM